MTLDEAKDALRNGAPFGDAYQALIWNCYNTRLGTDATDNAITELRRFFCYELPLQERWQYPRIITPPPSPPTTILSPLPPPTPKLSRQSAKQQGYEGDPCTVCGGMRVRRNGACLLCEECQTSSGCS